MGAKVQIVFHSMYGHVYRLAEAVAEGARSVPGAIVKLSQVPELVPDEALEKSGAKKARAAFAHLPVAVPAHLADADAIIFGTPTRFGNMCAQMRNFLDRTTAGASGRSWSHRAPRRWLVERGTARERGRKEGKGIARPGAATRRTLNTERKIPSERKKSRGAQ